MLFRVLEITLLVVTDAIPDIRDVLLSSATVLVYARSVLVVSAVTMRWSKQFLSRAHVLYPQQCAMTVFVRHE